MIHRLDLDLAAMKMLIRSPGFDEDGKILKRRRGKIRISVARIAFETPPKLCPRHYRNFSTHNLQFLEYIGRHDLSF